MAQCSSSLDAALHYIVDPNLVDRSTADLWRHPEVAPLFADPLAEGIRYYRKTGIFPINHGLVIRTGLAEKHPWVVLNLLKAFDRANDIANQERLEYHVATGLRARGRGGAARAAGAARHSSQPHNAGNRGALFP